MSSIRNWIDLCNGLHQTLWLKLSDNKNGLKKYLEEKVSENLINNFFVNLDEYMYSLYVNLFNYTVLMISKHRK